MRRYVFICLTAGVLAGCASGGKSNSSTDPGVSGPVIRVDNQAQGTVVSVNPTLRFVVMDFPMRRLPTIGQQLNLYRQGRKVGEVTVTGPIIETTAAGDLRAGEARLGDEAKED